MAARWCVCVCMFVGITTWHIGGGRESEFGVGSWSTPAGSGSSGVRWCLNISRTVGFRWQTMDISAAVGWWSLRSSPVCAAHLQLFPPQLDKSGGMDRTGRRSLWLAEWCSSVGCRRDAAAEQCTVVGCRCWATETECRRCEQCRLPTPWTCRHRPQWCWTANGQHRRPMDDTQSAYVYHSNNNNKWSK